MSEHQIIQRRKKVLNGTVVSDKMEKSCVVLVERRFQHPLYKKTVTQSKRYKVHDENNECKVGDQVRLVECKKISKDKNWRLLEITQRAV